MTPGLRFNLVPEYPLLAWAQVPLALPGLSDLFPACIYQVFCLLASCWCKCFLLPSTEFSPQNAAHQLLVCVVIYLIIPRLLCSSCGWKMFHMSQLHVASNYCFPHYGLLQFKLCAQYFFIVERAAWIRLWGRKSCPWACYEWSWSIHCGRHWGTKNINAIGFDFRFEYGFFFYFVIVDE